MVEIKIRIGYEQCFGKHLAGSSIVCPAECKRFRTKNKLLYDLVLEVCNFFEVTQFFCCLFKLLLCVEGYDFLLKIGYLKIFRTEQDRKFFII